MSAGVSFRVPDLNYPTAKLPDAVTPPCSLFYICFCRQRTLSTVRLGTSRCTARQCKCNQHRKSPTPTTKTCESCPSQSRSRPDDVSFQVQTGTQRTIEWCFQHFFSKKKTSHGAVIVTMRETNENRQSNTMPKNFEKRARPFFRNRWKCLPWILCARECC